MSGKATPIDATPRGVRADRPWQRTELQLGAISGAILVVSGLLHALLWAIEGGSLAGDISLRKPILFGLSAGVTMISLSWVMTLIPQRRYDRWFFSICGVAMVAEVTLITTQFWRGARSHFNRATNLDATILLGIELLIAVVTLMIADVTLRSFRERVKASSDMALAVRIGMAMLLAACLFGFVMVAHGNQQQELGLPPGLYGKAGAMKFPHGMPIHAIQYLPMVACIARWIGKPVAARLRIVSTFAIGIAAFAVFAVCQTFRGVERFELSWATATILAFAVCVLLAATLELLIGLLQEVAAGFGRAPARRN